MSITMYEVSTTVLLRGLDTLASYLDVAASFCENAKIAPTVLVNARLAPDMLSLAGQVQRASDTAKGTMARLADIESPSFADTETTFEELKQRLAKTVSFIHTVTKDQLEGSATREIDFKFRTGAGPLLGNAYLLKFAVPNFLFHVATAHDILRHNGVKIGKRDFLGEY